MRLKKPYILMLEDDPDDRMITDSIASQLDVDIQFLYLTYSNELFSALESGEQPALIMLDYNSKPQNGLEILKKLKSNPAYRSIPVIVLGESASDPHIDECYQLGANSFILKPGTYDLTVHKIRTFLEYWFQVAEL
ncbi:response regulator [Cytophagaceae bacterium DM2B3-1]|uniref:Response regulator n=1 Tax=Xanthocytophaga flava TaxID=3048013 RepID=A0AAE3QUL1_9BACT|nr:response regulator [Xanthocytophaga flavus]MDJ1469376.1 response regulator [Xanthocytophaga flavus]MDJ1483770.1 response regulator [Xanthocytophaga flavus]MDJ1494112.1 response regulator [Xanthocytophaga flavus]